MLAASARRAADAGSKSAEAYRAIKDMIVSLELPPAALLDERGLAERLAATYPGITLDATPGRAAGATTGTPEVRPSRSSRTRDSSPQISCAHGG